MNITDKFFIRVNKFTQKAVEDYAFHLGFSYLHGVIPENVKDKKLIFNSFKIRYEYNYEEELSRGLKTITLDKFFDLEQLNILNVAGLNLEFTSDGILNTWGNEKFRYTSLKIIKDKIDNLGNDVFYIRSYSREISEAIVNHGETIGYKPCKYLIKDKGYYVFNKKLIVHEYNDCQIRGMKKYTLDEFFGNNFNFEIAGLTCSVNHNIKIGCKTFTREQFDQIWEAAKPFMV